MFCSSGFLKVESRGTRFYKNYNRCDLRHLVATSFNHNCALVKNVNILLLFCEKLSWKHS